MWFLSLISQSFQVLSSHKCPEAPGVSRKGLEQGWTLSVVGWWVSLMYPVLVCPGWWAGQWGHTPTGGLVACRGVWAAWLGLGSAPALPLAQGCVAWDCTL